MSRRGRTTGDGSSGGPGAFRGWRRWAVACTLLLVTTAGVWLAAFSAVLGVREVRIVGLRQASAAQVRAAAQIVDGEPLLRIDTGATARRIGRLPAIARVTVGTSYPSTVTITVTERTAVGYRTDGPAVTLVDGSGTEFRRVAAAPAGLPRLDSAADADRGAAAAAVAAELPGSVAGKVTLITAGSTESVTLRLSDGRTVLWGGTDRAVDKARLLPALLGQPGTYFDLSDPAWVISRGAPVGTPPGG
jgi:cell division protein FtsQ